MRYEKDGSGAVLKEYQWDQQNRLVKALLGTHESDYFYDGESRRVRIKELESGTQTKDETFAWCGSRICQKRSASTVERNYFEQGFEEGTNDYFYTRDHLGSVREVVGSDGTSVASRTSYDPWGKSTGTGSGALSDFGFTGHYFDRPTSLGLTLFRGYDSNLGRWMSEDPDGLRGGLDLYAYVGNSSPNFLDPSGRGPVEFGLCLLSHSLSDCLGDEKKRLDGGPAGDCSNCTPVPGPGGGGLGNSGPPGRNPRDAEVIREACKQKAAYAAFQCFKQGGTCQRI